MWGAWPGYRPAAVAAVPRWVSAGTLFVIAYQPSTVAAGSCRQAWTLLKWRVLKAGDAQRVSPPRLGCSTLAP